MEVFTVSLFGHRELSDAVESEKRLYRLVSELIRTKEYVDFLVGRNGDYDTLASSVIRRAVKDCDYANASHILVLPYRTAEYKANVDNFSAYYSEVEICEQAADAHFKAAIQIRNQCMIDRSDLVVCYVEHKSGGAYKALKYAEAHGKKVINLASPYFSLDDLLPHI